MSNLRRVLGVLISTAVVIFGGISGSILMPSGVNVTSLPSSSISFISGASAVSVNGCSKKISPLQNYYAGSLLIFNLRLKES